MCHPFHWPRGFLLNFGRNVGRVDYLNFRLQMRYHLQYEIES
jgi:hypothetical protein